MGREVRKVPPDWKHPRNEQNEQGNFIPLFDGSDFEERTDKWVREGLQWIAGIHEDQRPDDERTWRAWTEYNGGPTPNPDDYMPSWSSDEATHLMMYECTTEGTPISPAFETAEELAHWLADNGASAFASVGATYEQWLATIKAGSAPSMIMTGGRMMSGVEAMGTMGGQS